MFLVQIEKLTFLTRFCIKRPRSMLNFSSVFIDEILFYPCRRILSLSFIFDFFRVRGYSYTNNVKK